MRKDEFKFNVLEALYDAEVRNRKALREHLFKASRYCEGQIVAFKMILEWLEEEK